MLKIIRDRSRIVNVIIIAYRACVFVSGHVCSGHAKTTKEESGGSSFRS
jgi:hypothetical protein